MRLHSGTEDNDPVYDAGTLFIDGSGEMYDFSIDADNGSDGDILPPWFDYREQVRNVLIGEGALSVGDYAFYGCNPETISIPDSVVSISDLPGSIESINCACDSYARNWAETNGFNAVFEHTAVNDIGYAATCIDTGLTDGSHCSLCGEVLAAQEEIPAGGHVWQEDYTVDQEATDLEDGRKSIHCSNCDAVRDEQIIPAGSNSTGESISENPAESAEENPAESAKENPAESVSENQAAEGEDLNEGQNPEGSSGEDSGEPEVKSIEPTLILSADQFVYNGKEQKPTVTVKDGTTTLATSDYTVTYGSGRKNVGSYNVLVRMKGNYSGTKTVTYKITAKKITPAVTLSRNAFTYNGTVQKPTVTVKDGSTVLTASNYTVTYGSGRKNVGIYNVLVTMKGNYSGSRKVQFEIVPKGTSISSLKAGKNTLTVNWNKQAVQTTGYQIQYSVKSDFSKAAAVTVSNSGTVTRNIGGLTRGCTYYVRIRTYKTVSGSNRYSSWSSAKTAKITQGAAPVFAKTPVVKVANADKRFTNRVYWNKLSGASGYEVSFKKGNGSWTILKRANQLQINHDVTHGANYYYRVRAYSDKKDGSRVYGGYSNIVRKIQYYSPSFSILTLDKTDPEISFYLMSVTNKGNYNLVFYSRNSMLIDHDYTSFNRDTFLIDSDALSEYHTLREAPWITIAPGETNILTYWVKGDPTWVDPKTTLFYEFKYDGVEYVGYTSHNSGSYYYKK